MGGPQRGNTDSSSARSSTRTGGHTPVTGEQTREWCPFIFLIIIWALVGIFSYIGIEVGGVTNVVPIMNGLFLPGSILSCIGSIYMVWMYAIKPKGKSEFFDMLIAMSVTDFFFAFKFLLSSCMSFAGDKRIVQDGTWLCHLSAFLGQFFGLGTISWNFMISLHLSLLLSPYRDKTKRLGRFKVGLVSHGFVWSFSTLTAIAAYMDNGMGKGPQGTCWLLNEHVFTFYGPLFIYFWFAIVVVMVAIRVLLRSHKGGPERIVVFQISLFTLSFILVWAWAIVMRAIEWSDGKIPLWLQVAQAFYLGSGGFWNFFIWLMPSIRRKRQQTRHSANTNPSIELDDKRNAGKSRLYVRE